MIAETDSTATRLELMQTLMAIAPEHLEMILFVIKPPDGIIPPISATQGHRVSALLKWAEAPGGCTLSDVKQILENVISSKSVVSSFSPQQQQIEEKQAINPLEVLDSYSPQEKFTLVTIDSSGKEIKRESKQAQYFRENLPNNVTLEMVAIPGGTFTMGSPKEEKDSRDWERPQHQVIVPPLFMGKYPITQAQWKEIARLPQIARELKVNPSYFKGERRPVEGVSWYDAIEFCARLSHHTGRNYRLASEAEWEYACRGRTTTPFHFGETISTDLANYNGTDEKYGAYGRGKLGVSRGETTEVGYFGVANAFGLSEMHGNVWEWCLDPWHSNYENAPSDGRVWDEQNDNDNRYQDIVKNIEELLTNNQRRVVRGGSWFYIPNHCRSAYRYFNFPVNAFNLIGFRVVLGVPRT